MKSIVSRALTFLLSMALFFTSVYITLTLNKKDDYVPVVTPVQTNSISDEMLAELWDKTNQAVLEISFSGAEQKSADKLQQMIELLKIDSYTQSQKSPYLCLQGLLTALTSYKVPDGDQKSLGKFLGSTEGKVLSHYTKLTKSDLFLCASALREKSRNDDKAVVLSICGDTAFGTYPNAKATNKFAYVFENVAKGDYDYPLKNCYPFFKTDDFTVMNNETSVSKNGKLIDKLWPINSDPKYLKIYNLASVDAVNLGNNHTKDCGGKGYFDTMNNLKNSGIGYFDKGMPYSTNVDGLKIVFLGYDVRVSVSGAALKSAILADIKKYKQQDTVVLVSMHWGKEYQEQPLNYQKDYAYAFLDAGADMIIGGHPHIMQGIEQYKGKYILYSISDFMFGADPDLLSRMTAIFRLRIDKATKNIGLEIVPTYENSDGKQKGYNNFQPLPVCGNEAEPILSYLSRISKPLKYGVTSYNVFNPF